MVKLNEPLCESSFPAEELIGPAHERERLWKAGSYCGGVQIRFSDTGDLKGLAKRTSSEIVLAHRRMSKNSRSTVATHPAIT